MTIQQRSDEALLVNAHGNGLTHSRILNNGTRHVHGAKERAGGLNAGELIVVVFKVGVSLICHAVSRVDISRLQGSRQGITVRKGTDGQLVDLRRTVPVIFVFRQGKMVIRNHVHNDIRAGTGNDTCVEITGIHINDAAVRIAQIVHKCRIRLTCGDGQNLSVRLHIRDLSIAGRTVMVFQHMLEALLYSLCIHRIAALKQDAVAQLKRPHQSVLRYGIVIHQIFLYVHAVIQLKQGFHHTDTHAPPGISAGRRIHIPHIIAKHKIPSCILFCPASDARTCRYQHT